MHLVLSSRSERGGARRAPTKRVFEKVEVIAIPVLHGSSTPPPLRLSPICWVELRRLAWPPVQPLSWRKISPSSSKSTQSWQPGRRCRRQGSNLLSIGQSLHIIRRYCHYLLRVRKTLRRLEDIAVPFLANTYLLTHIDFIEDNWTVWLHSFLKYGPFTFALEKILSDQTCFDVEPRGVDKNEIVVPQ